MWEYFPVFAFGPESKEYILIVLDEEDKINEKTIYFRISYRGTSR